MKQQRDLSVQAFVAGSIPRLQLRAVRHLLRKLVARSISPISFILIVRSLVESSGLRTACFLLFRTPDSHLLPGASHVGRYGTSILFDLMKPENCRRHIPDAVLGQPLDRRETGTQPPNLLFDQSPLVQQIRALYRHPLPERRQIKGFMPLDLSFTMLNRLPNSLQLQFELPPNSIVVDHQQRPALAAKASVSALASVSVSRH